MPAKPTAGVLHNALQRATERTAYFVVAAVFFAGDTFAGFAGSSVTAAPAASRFTASMPLTHRSLDSSEGSRADYQPKPARYVEDRMT
jgi:hypothetical protein